MKISDLEPDTTIVVSFDAESNGLHGQTIAIGGVALNLRGKLLQNSVFSARIPDPSDATEYVRKNIIPSLDELPVNFVSGFAMRDAFWLWLRGWYLAALRDPSIKHAIVVMDCGTPVETNLLSACVADDRTRREYDIPYPTHEIASLLLAVDVDSDVDREEYVRSGTLSEVFLSNLSPTTPIPERKHDPRYDALVSGMCAVQAINHLQLNKKKLEASALSHFQRVNAR